MAQHRKTAVTLKAAFDRLQALRYKIMLTDTEASLCSDINLVFWSPSHAYRHRHDRRASWTSSTPLETRDMDPLVLVSKRLVRDLCSTFTLLSDLDNQLFRFTTRDCDCTLRNIVFIDAYQKPGSHGVSGLTFDLLRNGQASSRADRPYCPLDYKDSDSGVKEGEVLAWSWGSILERASCLSNEGRSASRRRSSRISMSAFRNYCRHCHRDLALQPPYALGAAQPMQFGPPSTRDRAKKHQESILLRSQRHWKIQVWLGEDRSRKDSMGLQPKHWQLHAASAEFDGRSKSVDKAWDRVRI